MAEEIKKPENGEEGSNQMYLDEIYDTEQYSSWNLSFMI